MWVFFKQLTRKYLEDHQAVSVWSGDARWAPFPCCPLPWSRGSGDAWHLPLATPSPLRHLFATWPGGRRQPFPESTSSPGPRFHAWLADGWAELYPVLALSQSWSPPWRTAAAQGTPPCSPKGRQLGRYFAPRIKGRPCVAWACTHKEEGAKGNSWARLQPALTYIGEKKLRGGKKRRKNQKRWNWIN